MIAVYTPHLHICALREKERDDGVDRIPPIPQRTP